MTGKYTYRNSNYKTKFTNQTSTNKIWFIPKDIVRVLPDLPVKDMNIMD